MRTLILSQHFAPEVTAARFRMQAFAEQLTGRGHAVTVVTAVPNHPAGVIAEGYRRRLTLKRQLDGVDVRYVWVFTRPQKTFWTRIGFYASYAATASLLGAVERRPDVILASSPPLPVGVAGMLLAGRHRAPWVLDVRDLWPQSAVALGELTNPRAVAAAERLERRLYRSADALVTVNDAFAREIAARAPQRSRIEVIPNGTTRAWLDAGEREPDRAAAALPQDRFVWAYAGNLGLAHGLEHAIEAARLLGDGYRLVVIGDGPQREALERLGADAGDLVEFRGLMDPAAAAVCLRAADALLVSERQEHSVASKLYDYAAIGRPIVAACRGELRRVIESERVGLAVEHGDAAALAGAVRSLASEQAAANEMVARGAGFAREHLREVQAGRMVDLLEQVAGATG